MRKIRTFFIRHIIHLAYKIDQFRGKIEHYDYESAPYCGHHYSGAEGNLYKASYSEMGGAEIVRFWGFEFENHDGEGYSWGYKSPF